MKVKPLIVTHASENNLKEVSVEIPHDTLCVVTGLSGSGKSSLAFDTIYAEGQRAYIETFSPYTRQFLDKIKKPDVDRIENPRPAIAIQQRTRILNSRSTVGSMTNLNDYLKILWSNVAQPICSQCGIPLQRWDAPSLADHLLAFHARRSDTTLMICASLPRTESDIERLVTLGYSRWFDLESGNAKRLEDEAPPSQQGGAPILVVIDRISQSTPNLTRLRDSISQAFALSHSPLKGGATCTVVEIPPRSAHNRPWLQVVNNPTHRNRKQHGVRIHTFFDSFTCEDGALNIERPRPALFTFNHPLGACPECRGFGKILAVDPERCVPKPTLSIREHALQCWSGNTGRPLYRRLLKFCESRAIPSDVPWRDLSPEQQELIFNHSSREFVGVRTWFKRLEKKAYKMHVRVFLAKYRGQFTCPTCHGDRLKPAALAYQVEGKRLPEIWSMSVSHTLDWISRVRAHYQATNRLPRELRDIFDATISRLRYLENLGLGYLTLERQARTLSGGETQRVNLATALGSDLVSTHFVLDEPSVGLHSRDTERLIGAIRELQTRGNSVLVVEHDLDFIHEADHIVELGPKAGNEGGNIVFDGPAKKWGGITISRTLPAPRDSKPHHQSPSLRIEGATIHNLKNISLSIPLQSFVCLSGVSGSGKSTLMHEVIEKGYNTLINGRSEEFRARITGFEHVEQVIAIDQAPISKSPRGNIATYCEIWEEIRSTLADTDLARERALSKSNFSFNVDGGRCPTCKGSGFIREDMQFLSDVYVPCEVCLGKRFQPAVLEVTYRGKNAHDLLGLSAEACATFFHHNAKIRAATETLCQVGLGHLTLGHPLSELSGGEAQRLKLIPFIQRLSKGKALLLFDEPTTGLHYHDVLRLIELFESLRAEGHSIICVEHNLTVLGAADWIIDLGPEGGDGGGSIVCEGTPQQLIAAERTKPSSSSYTAKYLADFFKAGAQHKREKNAPVATPPTDRLTIEGACEHNLKNVDLSIPLGRFVAFTGVSGSGKSTLAKDIIYAEGQRRYLDCLSPYARQFIRELKRPEIRSIKNVQPTICVYQHTFQPSRLSTIGTMSEVHNFLRLLFAKTGSQHCPDHPNEVISPLSAAQIAAEIKNIDAPSVRILAPIIKSKKGTHTKVLERAIASEITQLRVDGVFLDAGSITVSGGLERSKVHSIDFVVAKFNPSRLDRAAIEDAVHQALALGSGTVIVCTSLGEQIFSIERTCPVCKRGFFKPDPEDLSFHSRRGACEKCGGVGVSARGKECAECRGSGLKPTALSIRLNGKNIHEASLFTPSKLKTFLTEIDLPPRLKAVATPILSEVESKLKTLIELGLDYLPLRRSCASLSGGELQRLRLATALGSSLTGVMYIFDEPSVGLHPIDNQKVLAQLRTLTDRQNSVIMIEHDPESILAADSIVDVGPGGGRNGGEIVFAGDIGDFVRVRDSVTAQCLRAPIIFADEPKHQEHWLAISNGAAHNIRDLKVKLPLGSLVSVCGVSGAGKSSLVHNIIADTIREGKKSGTKYSSEWGTVVTPIEIARILEVDQTPIGANSRSTPASYLGIWDEIRKIFANSIEAKTRGWSASYFSYNTGKGRCPECKGLGQITLEMNFLPDAQVPCERCNGIRFSDEVEEIHYRELSAGRILRLTFEEARTLFAHHRRIHHPLHQACELGLGYLTLGQSSKTLSGGESQRIKLVTELGGSKQGHTLYLLDEPTTGLHRADVARLMQALKALVALGNTVLVIEHDADVIAQSDYLLELGPEAGEGGGRVVFSGTPKELVRRAKTAWGKILQERRNELVGHTEKGYDESANRTCA